MPFVYPRGATLNLQRPAIPVLTSGYLSYPVNRPIAAAWEGKKVGFMQALLQVLCPPHCPNFLPMVQDEGRILVLGSAEVFSDDWLSKEKNNRLQELLFGWIMRQPGCEISAMDAEHQEISDYVYIPDISSLSERLRSCLQVCLQPVA